MTDTAIPVRHVATAARLEFHAETCGHRIPRGADIHHSEMFLEDVRGIDAESLALNTQRPVMPCLRKVAGIK